MNSDLRFPIGPFSWSGANSAEDRIRYIQQIADCPPNLRAAVEGLSKAQLDTSYRPGGWTVRQVVHHLQDSHMNAYVRLKLALTEDNPTIKPYDEAAWAQLADSLQTPVEVSLALLENLHRRFVTLFKSLEPEQWKRTFQHPELGPVSLDKQVALYVWHGAHHVAQITGLRVRNGW